MDEPTLSIHETLLRLLTDNCTRFHVIRHESAGRSEEVAEARGTVVGQGAKALVCEIRGSEARARWVLAVLPADRKLDRERLAEFMGGDKAKLVDTSMARKLTGCEIGAIPPFSFHPQLHLVVDAELIERYDTIAFNAGRLDVSVLLNSQDFIALARPSLTRIGCTT